MEEDYMATTRNGHNLKDMYNPETNTLDIRSNGLYPSNVLSNLCSNGFRFEGMVCGSMEGFLQSLKRKELDKQRQICSMRGGNARKMSVTSWQTDQMPAKRRLSTPDTPRLSSDVRTKRAFPHGTDADEGHHARPHKR